MRRREFITVVGCTAAAWPITTRAQQAPMPVIGLLDQRSPDELATVCAQRQMSNARLTGIGSDVVGTRRNLAVDSIFA